MNTKKIITITTALALAATAALPAFAQTNNQGEQNGQPTTTGWQGQGNSAGAPGHTRGAGMMNSGPGVSGTVSSVSGNIITIAGHQRTVPGTPTSTTTYTVDATSATIKKNNTTSTVSSITVGDRIFAAGTITGTNVVATSIIDGLPSMMGGRGKGQPGATGSSTSPFIGSGQPIIAGSIGSISGNTVTVTTATNVTYTVDVTNAKVVQGPNTVSLSTLTVGEKVIVQGTVNGNSVTATTIIDQTVPAGTNTTPGQGMTNPGQHMGFFGGIGNFFKHLFGF